MMTLPLEQQLFNSGGPMSRTRTERLVSSVVGNSKSRLILPRRHVVGLRVPSSSDPVTTAWRLLEDQGFSSAEAARQALATYLPSKPLAALPWQGIAPISLVMGKNERRALVEALVLGLCTATLYDPERAILWTGASLTRRLELFDLGAFYAA
jgi:hypothetical protein